MTNGELPDDLYERRAPETARRLALALLDQLTSARLRLNDADDVEALHDFRVALRRLRSCERAYRDVLSDSIREKDRRRLRRLAAATGESRDAEVHRIWLDEQRESLSPRHQRGRIWITERITQRKVVADDALHAAVEAEFTPLRDRLAERLREYRLVVSLDERAEPETGAHYAAALITHLVDTLERRLAAVHDVGDEAKAHRARIEAKRLRYALEPIAENDAQAAAAVRSLRKLQDTLGDLHDSHVFSAELADAMEDAAKEEARHISDLVRDGAPPEQLSARRRSRQNPRLGLIELARRLHERGERAFAVIARDWLDGRAAPLLGEIRACAHRLSRDTDSPSTA